MAFCLAIIAAFSFKITDTPIFRRGTALVTYLDDATGVFENSKVKLAGIDIGVISRIELENGKAKIHMRIDRGVSIPEGSRIIPRPLGILGDKYLEVVLPKVGGDPIEGGKIQGTGEQSYFRWPVLMASAQAQTPARNLKEGEVIKAESSPATLDDLTRQMGTVSEDIKAVSSSLRRLIEGEPDPKTPLGRTVRNVEKISQDLNLIIQENRQGLRSTVQRLNRATQKLEKALDGVDEQKLSRDLENLSQAAGNLGESLADVKRITSKIERGEGSLGILINDDGVARGLQKSLNSLNSAVDRAERTKIVVDLHGFSILEESRQFQSEFGLRLLPRESSGYFASLVSTPRGRTSTRVETVRVNGSSPTVTETVEEERSAFSWSLQYYRRLGPLAARLGIIENSGGLGVDAFFLKDRVQLSSDFFDFSRTQSTPQVRLLLRVFPVEEIYFIAGRDDVLLSDRAEWVAGLGLRFTDDDLKTLLVLPGVP